MGLSAVAAAAASIFAAVLLGWLSEPSIKVLAEVGTGYGARLGCSIVFVAHRSLESAKQAEFVFPPINWAATLEINRETLCVTATSTFYPASRTACWLSPRRGCSLTWPPGSVPKTAQNQTADLSVGVTQQKAPQGRNFVDFEALDRVVSEHFDDTRLHARGLLLLHGGEVVYERYGNGANASTRLLGWSCTKSVISALIGRMVMLGYVSLDATIDLPEWSQRDEVTLEQMLRMTSGTSFDEWYEPGWDVTDMLFRSKSAFFGNRSARTRPGRCFQYSSHTTNALCRWMRNVLQRRVGLSDEEYHAFPTMALFEPLGAQSFVLESDPEGTFIGSSFSWATARDWAKFGSLYLNDGLLADGTRLLPEGWAKFSASPTETSGGVYGAHWWLGGRDDDSATLERTVECDGMFPSRKDPDRSWWTRAFPFGTFAAHGFEGQLVAVVPSKNAVLVRLGATKEVVLSWDREHFYQNVLAAVPDMDS